MRALRYTLCALAAAGLMPVAAADPQAQRAGRLAPGWRIDSLMLQDHAGQPFTQARFDGRWTFMLPGRRECGQPCSAAADALQGLLRRIERADARRTTAVLLLSLDAPDRGWPAWMPAPLPAGFTAASGTPGVVARLLDDLEATADEGEGRLFLVGPDASVRAEYLPPFDVARLTAAYLKRRIGR